MTTKKKSAIEQIEELGGGPLTFGRMIESLRKCDELSQAELAAKQRQEEEIASSGLLEQLA